MGHIQFLYHLSIAGKISLGVVVMIVGVHPSGCHHVTVLKIVYNQYASTLDHQRRGISSEG